jgi:16S rRNA processing protein RimM
VRLSPLTDEPARLRELREGFLVPPAEGERCRLEAVWFQGPVPVVKFEGRDTLDDAEALVGRLLAVPRDAVRPLPANRFYAFDLVGCRVEAPDGRALGEVRDVLASPAHDLWVVRDGGREWLVPAVSAIVERVDLAARRVVVRAPEGLTELEA